MDTKEIFSLSYFYSITYFAIQKSSSKIDILAAKNRPL